MNINKTSGTFFRMGLTRPEKLITPDKAATPGQSIVKKRYRPGRFLIIFMIAVMVPVLLAASGARAEKYSSADHECPTYFESPIDAHNDMQHMEAIHYDDKDIILFTMFSDQDGDFIHYTSDLHYWINQGYYDEGAFGIWNNRDDNLRIKACVFNDLLYIFSSPSDSMGYSSNTWGIFYRQAKVVMDTNGHYQLEVISTDNYAPFNEPTVLPPYEKPTKPSIILYAGVMNGRLYIYFSDGNDWYWAVSEDGRTFGPATPMGSFPGIFGVEGEVFLVQNADGLLEERTMLTGCRAGQSSITYFFFDGQSIYGENTISTGSIDPRSVQLIAGSAEGYNNKNYSIQVFFAYPDGDGADERWSRIYHGEYIPSGENGDQGSWSSSWTYLSNDTKDHIHCSDAYDSDQRWSVFPSDEGEGDNIRNHLRIWYARGTHATAASGDRIEFRESTYKSDLWVHAGRTVTKPEEQSDMSTATIVGIIEGTPPFPENKVTESTASTNTSVVSLGTSTTEDVSTTWSAGGSIGVAYNKDILKKTASIGARFSAMLKYTQGTTSSTTASISETFKTYMNTPAGNLGWALFFVPEIIADQYILKSYDGTTQVYGDNSSMDEMDLFLIQYGEDSEIVPRAYYLDDPDCPVGGTNDYTDVFSGMAERPLSTDLANWEKLGEEYKAPSPSFIYETLPINSPLTCTQGEQIEQRYSETDADWETNSANANFSISRKKLGFGSVTVDTSISFSMEMSTKTAITTNLGFILRIPNCCENCDDPCVSNLKVEPVLLTPNEDDTGYNAPWISDDIRDNNKPKPWCLSYLTYPEYSESTVGLERFSVKNASANLYLNRVTPDKDKLSAEITLSGLPNDFFPQDLALLHFKFGDYVVHTDRNPIVEYAATDEKVVVSFEEPGNPDAFIRLTLHHKPYKSLLKIYIKAHGIDLSELESYLTGGGETGSVPDTVPFSFFMDNKYYATEDLAAIPRIYEKKIKCRLLAGE